MNGTAAFTVLALLTRSRMTSDDRPHERLRSGATPSAQAEHPVETTEGLVDIDSLRRELAQMKASRSG